MLVLLPPLSHMIQLNVHTVRLEANIAAPAMPAVLFVNVTVTFCGSNKQ